MKSTNVEHGKMLAANSRLWGAIGDEADTVVNRINTDPQFVEKVARVIVDGLCEPINSQVLAREIMGKNFFGIEDVIRYFGVKPTKQQLAALAEVPFSVEVLQSCKDTHILVAGFPLSILDIRGIAKKQSDQTLFYSQDWYDKQAFAKDKGKVGWQLVRKEPIANSTSKTWNDQQALLSNEETPTARIVVYTMIGHFLATGERLFEEIYVRTATLDSGADRVNVGYFDSEGLHLSYWNDDSRDDGLGLSAVRKQ